MMGQNAVFSLAFSFLRDHNPQANRFPLEGFCDELARKFKWCLDAGPPVSFGGKIEPVSEITDVRRTYGNHLDFFLFINVLVPELSMKKAYALLYRYTKHVIGVCVSSDSDWGTQQPIISEII